VALVLLLGCVALAIGTAPAHPPPPLDPVHARLAAIQGEWSTDSQLWLSATRADSAPPDEVTRGSASFAAVMDGRFLQESYQGVLAGDSFTSLRLWGFNSDSNRHEAVWANSASTALMTLRGTSNDLGRTVTYLGTYESAGPETVTLEIIRRVLDEDRFVLTVSGPHGDGAPGPLLQTIYTRKPAGDQAAAAPAEEAEP
jgi:hypothetical protein